MLSSQLILGLVWTKSSLFPLQLLLIILLFPYFLLRFPIILMILVILMILMILVIKMILVMTMWLRWRLKDARQPGGEIEESRPFPPIELSTISLQNLFYSSDDCNRFTSFGRFLLPSLSSVTLHRMCKRYAPVLKIKENALVMDKKTLFWKWPAIRNLSLCLILQLILVPANQTN